MRSLSPSTTLVCTRTLSPTANFAGSLRNCSDSILSSNAWFINFQSGVFERRSIGVLEYWATRSILHRSAAPSLRFSQKIRPSFLRALPGLLGPPARNFRVIAGQQHFRDFHPPELRRPRILRIFEQSVVERLFVRARFIAQHPGQ